MNRRRPTSEAGFTLMELLLVIGLVAILLAFAIPRVNRGRFRVDAQVQTFGFVLNTAQREAVLRQHDVILSFEMDTGRLRVTMDVNNSRQADTGERVSSYPLEEGVAFGLGGAPGLSWGTNPVTFPEVAGEPTLTFHRNGSASSFGAIYLTSTRGLVEHARAIEVERATGEVRCHSYRTGSWELTC